jgi:hypothetical protein
VAPILDGVTVEPKIGPDGWYDDWPEWAKNPLSEDARGIPWRDMRVPTGMENERTRRYVEWMRATHNGRRTPQSPECSECGEEMSEHEIAEYEAAQAP